MDDLAVKFYEREAERLRKQALEDLSILDRFIRGDFETIRFVNSEPSASDNWKHFWKQFFEWRDRVDRRKK